jgi:hypothetical protein
MGGQAQRYLHLSQLLYSKRCEEFNRDRNRLIVASVEDAR